MEHSKLNSHTFKKGKFITPWHNSLGDILHETSWFHDRLPEYIWIGLVIKKYGRTDGLIKCARIASHLNKLSPNLDTMSLSDIFKLNESKQKNFWIQVASEVETKALSPLTAIFTYSKCPAFAEVFCTEVDSFEERINRLIEVMRDASDHQTHFATDIRFIALYFNMLSGKLHMPKEMGRLVLKYPKLSHDDTEMQTIRPTIRAMEMNRLDRNNQEYLNYFWEVISKMTDCNLFYINFEKNANDTDIYLDNVKEIMSYYSDLFISTDPLNTKMLVLLGISTYSYKRLLEVVNHNLYNAISGRSIVRILIEDYIMIKYLIQNESTNSNIWSEYQYYGIGQYKLIAKRAEGITRDLSESHVSYDYLGILANELKDEEFIDMDTRYFDKQGIREKAISVDEKELYTLYYDYDSAFEHGLWGAIRESSLLKCDEPSHQYHCVPDINNVQNLKSVWNDCKMVMDKTLTVLRDVYGLPDQYSI